MKIYLELIIFIFIPFTIFIFWYMWRGLSRRRLLKKYNPEKDLGKLAEDKRKEERNQNGKKNTQGRERSFGGVAGTEQQFAERIKDSLRSEKSGDREQLPIPEVGDDGKTNRSNRKNGKGIRRIFGRGRRRR